MNVIKRKWQRQRLKIMHFWTVLASKPRTRHLYSQPGECLGLEEMPNRQHSVFGVREGQTTSGNAELIKTPVSYLQHLTLIACSNCRKKRTKCDGRTPCERCKSREEDCTYESRMWRTKGQLRAEVESLHTQRQHTQAVLQALVSRHHCRQVLRKLRQGESLASIAARLPRSLQDGERYRGRSASVVSAVSPGTSERSDPLNGCIMVESPDAIDNEEEVEDDDDDEAPQAKRRKENRDSWWEAPSHASIDSLEDDSDGSSTSFASPTLANTVYSPNSLSVATPATEAEVSRRVSTTSARWGDSLATVGEWTTVTKDVRLIRELVGLYFSWEQPAFPLLCKEPFMRDWEERRNRYCSSALVNAILSLACRFLDLSSGRSDGPRLSDRFFHEAKRQLADERDVTLPDIQTVGVLALREMACGREADAARLSEDCVKMAQGVLRNNKSDETLEDAEYHVVRGTTICGAFSLCRLLYVLSAAPFPSLNGVHDGSSPMGQSPSKSSDEGLSITEALKPEFMKQISHCESISKAIFELTELAYTSLTEIYQRKRPMTGNDLMEVYTKYLRWYESAFEGLRTGNACSPAVLFLHIYFQYGLILLFGPFGLVSLIGSDFTPRAMCAEAAQAISSLTQIYSRLFTLRKAPCFLPYFVFSATMAQVLPCIPMKGYSGGLFDTAGGSPTTPPLLTGLSPDASTTLNCGITQLADMSECHPAAAHGMGELTSLRAFSAM